MYKSTGQTYSETCKALGINADIRAIQVMMRNNKIYVRGTLLKPDEAHQIAFNCNRLGFHYKGPFA